ncbi:MAG: M56 family metallopeptidase [Lachnospiraceae bacterium]|nr:M56 family metallopeptidase [Lachnospiraceae bacterium]
MMRFIGFLVGSGSLIGMMLLIRAVLRSRIPAGLLYMLWLVPAVRLLFPFTLIPVPVLPEAAEAALVFDESDEEEIADNVDTADNTDTAQGTELVGIGGTTEAVLLTESREDGQGEGKTERLPNHLRTEILSWLPYLWLSGSILCGGYVILINRRLKRSIKQMKRLPEERLVPVYVRKETVSPCLFGLFHPCIFLPEQTAENRDLCCQALLHEETHYRQKDHIWTALRILLCIIYWWNPLVWLGAVCAREDAEFACDARALKGASLSEKKAYGYALLEIVQGAQHSGMLVKGITPISGKGKNMKRRLENIVSENRRTRLWLLPVCLLLVLFLCGLCFPAQRVRAEEETAWEPNAQAGSEIEKAAVGESDPVEKETDTDVVNQVEPSEIENAQEDQTEEMETGIWLHPQAHREGYGEPDLSYTASAGWLTDLTDRRGEQERIESLARRALRELYDLTGYQVEECFYGYNEIGMLVFARSEEDMEHSRVFYSYSMGEKDGYDMISSIDIVSARRVRYSDVQQLALPENAESMEREELTVWFLEHSPLCPEGRVATIEPLSESEPDRLKLTMEDGTFYEIDIDMEILSVNNIYGPYPESAQH